MKEKRPRREESRTSRRRVGELIMKSGGVDYEEINLAENGKVLMQRCYRRTFAPAVYSPVSRCKLKKLAVKASFSLQFF